MGVSPNIISMNYLEIFNNIRKDIDENPYLELVEFNINKGLTENEFENKKKELLESSTFFKAIKMDPIFEFYKQCNGIKLKWKISSNLDENIYNKLPEKFPDLKLPHTRDLFIGNINILPFDDVFIYEQDFFEKSDSGDFFTQFGDYIYEGNSFGKLLFIFDLFSDTQSMSFVPDEDNTSPKVILLSDYYIVWDNSMVSYFNSYINFLVCTRGLIESRNKVFNKYRGDKLEPLIYESVPFNTHIEPMIFRNK